MSKLVKLSKAVKYSQEKIPARGLTLDNFITVDNMLSNKEGIKRASSLPPGSSSLPAYRPGNILVGNIRPYLKKIWLANQSGGSSADVLNFEVEEGFSSSFVFYSLFRDDFFRHMMKGAKGTKMPRGDKSHILEFLIPQFDLKDQEKIGSALSLLDKKIRVNNQIIDNLESLSQLLYEYWFIQFEFKDSNGNPYTSAGGELVWNEPLKRNIPNGWDVGFLSDLGSVQGGSTPSTSSPDNFDSSGIPWITPKDLSMNESKKFVSSGEISLSERGVQSANLKLFPKGSILLSSRAPIGYMAIASNDLTTNQGFKSFIPDKDFSTPYMYYTIKHSMPTIINYSSGSTFKEISGTVLKEVKVCLAPKDVVDKFSFLIAPYFNLQEQLELENMGLQRFRDWLIPLLMNEQIKVQ
jgi:type I restriction enzyme S subunit